MALVESNSFEKGKQAPDFTLLNTVTGVKNNLVALKGAKGTVILFICNHCPYVIRINQQLIKLANDYKNQGINFIAISSNDAKNYPQDGPDRMKQQAEQLGYPFPYLYDETQEVAKAYDAVCTPDFYIFDDNLKSVYHGRLDDSTKANGKPITGNAIRKVLDTTIENKPLTIEEHPSMGCSIKWK